MDILRDGNSVGGNIVRLLVLVGTIVAAAARESLADDRAAGDLLIATYKPVAVLTSAEANAAVAGLENALVECEDSYLAFRIRYRVGVLYFKANMMQMSRDRFLQIANNSECPESVRICSFNMIGQISRLEGKNVEALGAFDRVAGLLEQRLSKHTADPALLKLLCSALFSKGEIHEVQRDYAAGITDYSRLLDLLKQSKNEDMWEQYAPLLSDRISQLHLRQGDVEKYLEWAAALVAEYPTYYRTPIVKLEMECIKFLRGVPVDFEAVDGSFSAPARVIAFLKEKNKTLAPEIAGKFERLCEEYRHTSYGGTLLHYHYAWLLDALGQKDRAAEILRRVGSADIAKTDNQSSKGVVLGTLQEYARVQSAIMLGEKADYTDALQVLGSLRKHPDKSHLSELAKSVRESTEILKREVPKDESTKK